MAEPLGQVDEPDLRVRATEKYGFQEILEFADIAGPRVTEQLFHHLGFNSLDGCTELLVKLPYIMIDQDRDISLAVP